MKKIAFIQSDLNVGGIQKSLVNLLRNLDYTEYEADLYLFERGGFFGDSFPEKLNVIYLDTPSKRWSFRKFDTVVKKYPFRLPDPGKRYDLAVDFNSYQNVCAALAARLNAAKRVMWIHNDVKIKLSGEWKYRVLWHFFKGKFKIYDSFAAVSDGLIEPFCEMSGVDPAKVGTVNNFIDAREILRRAKEETEDFETDGNCFNLAAVGRLCYQKGYDIMLEAFCRASKERPGLRLYIIGDGEDREKLAALSGKLGIADKVRFCGNRSNPYACLARCDAFVSTSRYEGQPLNVMEAKVLGMPLIIAENLKKYVPADVECVSDVAGAMIKAEKTKPWTPDLLEDYDREIARRIGELAEYGRLKGDRL